MIHDLKYAVRALGRTPGTTIAAIAALALGIGANTALFSVFNTVLLRPMNYSQPRQLVEIQRHFGTFGDAPAVTAFKFAFWRSQNHSFQDVAAYNYFAAGMNLAGRGEPERITNLTVSAAFFRVLGVRPQLGRTFTDAEDKPGAGHFVVLSNALWKRRFNSDPEIVGRSLRLDGADYTVLGVMPASFSFPEHSDVWTPLQLTVAASDLGNNYKIIARLKDSVPLEQARADMELAGRRLRQQYGKLVMGDKESVAITRYQDFIVGDVRPALRVLMGAVAFLLLLACANVANLLLARSAARQHEIAVRTALGASRWRVTRQFLVESLLLAAGGGAVGILLAQISLPFLLRLAPSDLPLLSHITVDSQVLLFTLGVAFMTGILFGLFPALQSLRLGTTLRETGTRTTATAAAGRVRQMLIVGEIAISLVLLAGAALLVETFARLSAADPGFDTRNVLTMQMSLGGANLSSTAATERLIERVANRLQTIAGVRIAGVINTLPTRLGSDLPFEVVGRPVSIDQMPDELIRAISPAYFSAMRIPLRAGRVFNERDSQHAPAVLIVNEAFVRKFFPKQNPLGQHVLIGRIMGPTWADVPREIVGVVGDTRDQGLGTPPQPIMFEPFSQVPDTVTALMNASMPVNWVIRVASLSPSLGAEIRRETLAVSGGIPMAEPQALADVIGSSIAEQRFTMTLLAIFAGAALLLAAVGLYSVISYSVSQRTREIGVRSALGADAAAILRLVLGQGMRLAGIGLAVGLCAALLLTRLLESMLYGVRPSDRFVLSAVTLAIIALAASWLPARRAARIDPVRALRQE